ncbi:MAG: hypothetical protein IKR52_07710 [Paludibacteraceae bacterium]|nr:hypothetical protein [Paludibacteraceae bacterium]
MQTIGFALQKGNFITTYDVSGSQIHQFPIPFNATLAGYTADVVVVRDNLNGYTLYDAYGLQKGYIYQA